MALTPIRKSCVSKIKFVSIWMKCFETSKNGKQMILIHSTWEKVNIENNIPNIGWWKFLDWIWSNSGIVFCFNYFQPAKKPNFRWLWRLWQFVREWKIKLLSKNSSHKSIGYLIKLSVGACYYCVSYCGSNIWNPVQRRGGLWWL